MRKKRGRYGDGSLWRPKKSRYWWCQFVDPTKKGKDGKQNLRVRRSTKCVLKKDAAIVLAGWIAETRAKTPEDDSTLTLLDLRELDLMDQALQGHRSAPRVDQAWRQILRCLDDAKVSTLTNAFVRKNLVDVRRGENISNATIRQELARIKRGLKLAQIDGVLTNRPEMPSIRVDNARDRWWPEGDRRAFLEELDRQGNAWIGQALRFAFITGWRRTEVFRLEWKHVWCDSPHLKEYRITLPGSMAKSGKPRTFPYDQGDALDQLIREQRQIRGESPQVFVDGAGSTVQWGHFYRDWRKACERLGWVEEKNAQGDAMTHYRFHDARRVAVTDLVMAGVPEKVIMRVVGMTTRSIFDRYTIVDDSRAREALRSVKRS